MIEQFIVSRLPFFMDTLLMVVSAIIIFFLHEVVVKNYPDSKIIMILYYDILFKDLKEIGYNYTNNCVP